MINQTLEQKRKNLKIGQEHLLKGNEFLKEKNFKKALEFYYHALLYIKGLNRNEIFKTGLFSNIPKIINDDDDDDKLNETIDNNLISIYNSMALCQMKLKNYGKAMRTFKMALNIRNYNKKTLFRSDKSYLDHEKFDLDENDLKKADSISNDSGVKEILNQLRKLNMNKRRTKL